MNLTLSLKYRGYSVGDLQPSRRNIPIGTSNTPSVDSECGERYPKPETTAVPLQIQPDRYDFSWGIDVLSSHVQL
jgi:hypothetical protein